MTYLVSKVPLSPNQPTSDSSLVILRREHVRPVSEGLLLSRPGSNVLVLVLRPGIKVLVLVWGQWSWQRSCAYFLNYITFHQLDHMFMQI